MKLVDAAILFVRCLIAAGFACAWLGILDGTPSGLIDTAVMSFGASVIFVGLLHLMEAATARSRMPEVSSRDR